jgi:hypothetical protein
LNHRVRRVLGIVVVVDVVGSEHDQDQGRIGLLEQRIDLGEAAAGRSRRGCRRW